MITRVQLEGVLGGSLMNTLCFNVILEAMENSALLSKLAPSQRETIARGAHTVELAPNAVLDQAQVRSVRCVVTIEGAVNVGTVEAASLQRLERAMLFGETSSKASDIRVQNLDLPSRVALFTWEALAAGLDGADDITTASDLAARISMIKRIPIFASCEHAALSKLARVMTTSIVKEGEAVFHEGDLGTRLFIIETGSVTITIMGRVVRSMSTGDYFGERALLHDELRSATVAAVEETFLYSLDKQSFLEIMNEGMLEYMKSRIALQDTFFKFDDLIPVATIGRGSCGIVQLVSHRKTKVREETAGCKRERCFVSSSSEELRLPSGHSWSLQSLSSVKSRPLSQDTSGNGETKRFRDCVRFHAAPD